MTGRAFFLYIVVFLFAIAAMTAAQDEATAEGVFADPDVGISFLVPDGYRVEARHLRETRWRYDLMPTDGDPEVWTEESVFTSRWVWASTRERQTTDSHPETVGKITEGIAQYLEAEFTDLEPHQVTWDLQETAAGEPMGRVLYTAREPEYLRTGIMFVRVGQTHHFIGEVFSLVDLRGPSEAGLTPEDRRFARELTESLRFEPFDPHTDAMPQTQPATEPIEETPLPSDDIAAPAVVEPDHPATRDDREVPPAEADHDAAPTEPENDNLTTWEIMLLIGWTVLLLVIAYWSWIAKPTEPRA